MSGRPDPEALRREILEVVSKTGGHLASSLGAVELACALAEVFDPERDRVLWDVGHQSYAWKLLTRRRTAFGTLRQLGGESPFVNPDESPADAFVSGHAGNALAAALGLAAARDARGGDEHVVAVVGDASLANGETFEALNNCASATRKVILVINDNAMSIDKSRGATARLLGRVIGSVRYNRVKSAAEAAGHWLKLSFLRGCYHRAEQLLKSIWLANSLFEDLGLRYIGPLDGHNLSVLEAALTVAKEDKRSVVVHVATRKGKGFAPAEADPSAWHGVPPFDLSAPELPAPARASWSDVFGASMLAAGRRDARVCAVVAIYSTFLQRAFDQIMHDVCILNLPVVFAVDRAGCVGADGRTHHGMFDIPMLRCLPNMSVLQPRGAAMQETMLAAALARGGPVAIRWPRGEPAADEPAEPLAWGKAEPLSAPEARVQLWALGDQVTKARAAAAFLAEQGLAAGVVDARFAKPFDAELLARQRASGAFIASLENGAVAGGFGEAIGADARFGWPDAFVGQGTVEELEREFSFTARDVAHGVAQALGKAGA